MTRTRLIKSDMFRSVTCEFRHGIYMRQIYSSSILIGTCCLQLQFLGIDQRQRYNPLPVLLISYNATDKIMFKVTHIILNSRIDIILNAKNNLQVYNLFAEFFSRNEIPIVEKYGVSAPVALITDKNCFQGSYGWRLHPLNYLNSGTTIQGPGLINVFIINHTVNCNQVSIGGCYN